jgi:hypothetical protein
VLLPLRLFRSKISNLGLGTQVIQWLILQGSFFVVSVYLQEVWKYNAIKTGLILTPGTIGILIASAGADRFARRHPQRWLIIAGFLITAIGMILLLALVRAHSGVWTWIPGLFLFGAGIGVMLTSSVNVVQSSWPDRDQGDISGLSRSVSNPGILVRHRLGRLSPGGRQDARRETVRRRPHDDAGVHPDRPGPRCSHPPRVHRVRRTGRRQYRPPGMNQGTEPERSAADLHGFTGDRSAPGAH